MSSFFKGKPNDPGQKTCIDPPTIRVEEARPEFPPEGSFHHRAKETLQNLFTVGYFLDHINTAIQSPVPPLQIPPSHSRETSRSPSERGKSQGYFPALDITANSSISSKNRSVEVKNDVGKSRKLADRQMSVGTGEAIIDTEDQLVSTSDEIAEQTAQDSIQASKRQVQVMRTIGRGVSRERKLDKGKGREDQAEGPDGARGLEFLAAMPEHSYQEYDNCGLPKVDDREIVPRDQLSDIGTPSVQESAHVSTQGVVSQLHGAHHFTIGGNPRFENIRVKNEYNYANHAGYDITVLKEFVSFGALYNSFIQDPTRRVHPGTRQRVLKRIQDWIDTPSAKERIFWLHGPAGVGKSAIAQTIARSCAKGKLVATFFFYRSDPGRNNGNRLFTTLAWQFTSAIPATKNALIHSLIECPDIPMSDVETQFEELIVKPLLELKRSGVPLSTPVVIIDGVDECSDDSLQRRFLNVIGNAVKDGRVLLRFLICSRPEAHIQDTIDIFRSLTLTLDLAKLDDANHDIEIYLKAEFSRIATNQGLDPAWPGEEIIQELVYKASGQFIYASTVIKYVGDEHNSAETQLDIIRGLRPASNISPFSELDELYKEILRRQRDPVFLKNFLSLFIGRNGIMLLDDLHEDDAMLMNVSEKELYRKLRGMRSLLKFEPYIDVYHQSFLDFLQDSSRSGQYHIDKEAGTRQYLDNIVDSLVRHASTAIEGHDDHKIHPRPKFQNLANYCPSNIVLPIEEWQQALQPLLDLQNKLLTLPNFRSTWEFLPCNECTAFYTGRDLLLHLAFLLGASDRVLDSALVAKSHEDGSEEIHSNIVPLMPTETDRLDALGNDLTGCLSSLLPRLRGRKLGTFLGANTIRMMCSLLRFDHAETAMRLRSMLDAQNLMDAIDELINNKYSCSDYSADMSCKAVHLALEVYARVPVLPRSLFSKGTVGPHHDVWLTSRGLPETELLFQAAFMGKILDPSYILRVLWVYEDDEQLFSVFGKVNEDNESLRQWLERSNPSSVTRIRIMLSVAKAIRYFHSTGIVLHSYVDSDAIFLDSKFHARFRFLGLTACYVKETPYMLLGQDFHSHEANVFLFGCLFYEMSFNVKIDYPDRRESNSNPVAKRPSTPEIRDDEWQLIQRCCAAEKNRPSMDEVVREMEAWDIS